MFWRVKIFLIVFLIEIIIIFLTGNFVLAKEVGKSKFGETMASTTFSGFLDKGLYLAKESLLILWEKFSGVAGNFFAAASTIIEQKKPFLKEEWQKEKEEMKDDLIWLKNDVPRNLWQKVKVLLIR